MHLKMHFVEWKCLYLIEMSVFFSSDKIDNKSALIQIMACQRKGPQSIVWINIWHHQTTMILTHKKLETHWWLVSSAAIDVLKPKHQAINTHKSD